MNKNENLEKLEQALFRLNSDESVIYFLTYDTKNTPRAAIKHIYDIALTLKNSGKNVKLLVEDKTYGGVNTWLDETIYDVLEKVSIKEDKVEINVDDTIVVPEYYSNVLDQLSNLKCTKIMLIQQKEFMFETLSIGSRYMDFGFDKIITTSENAKKYISEYFPENIIYVIPPMIGDNFSPTDKNVKPYIAISCRDRVKNRKLISEFYLKYPQLRWVSFRDMVQMTYEEFSTALKECMVSLWVDDESTFGTFPLESMKCGVPVIGKVPINEPDWLTENAIWSYDENKLTEFLGKYLLAWLDGVELTEDVKVKMKETLLPYETETTKTSIISIFESFKNKRIEIIQKALTKFKTEETV